ncbi:MAG: shikimate kinase [Anaerolineae bacterium]|nr:shikimate kinase [Anaerolineae bacterium]
MATLPLCSFAAIIPNMRRANIVLTGFMGTGKSTVGRLIAKQLAYDFVDTDEWIEAEDGRSIADIFREAGEAAFRQLERTAALTFAKMDGMVIATGGRLMLDEGNAAALMENGRVFCLVAEPEEIVARVSAGEKRPLLNVPDPAARVQELLNQRREAYGRFPPISTTGKTPAEVAQEIVDEMREV